MTLGIDLSATDRALLEVPHRKLVAAVLTGSRRPRIRIPQISFGDGRWECQRPVFPNVIADTAEKGQREARPLSRLAGATFAYQPRVFLINLTYEIIGPLPEPEVLRARWRRWSPAGMVFQSLYALQE